jgi:tripartite-type tricarboxylate transporter receptor subunit TctC
MRASITLKGLLAVGAASLAAGAGAALAATPADAWPNRPVRLLVPFSAGSATDMFARAVSARLTDHYGQQFIVDNRPSAGGTVAAQAVATANPDGYTLSVVSSGHAINATLYPKLPYDTLRDFAGISLIATQPGLVVVSPSLGVSSIRDLIALAKQKSGVLFASAGVGSGTHLSAEQFRFQAGIDVTHVPYKGAPEALTDTMAGRTQFFFAPFNSALSLVKDGRLRAIAVTSAQRAPQLPNVPTIAESGVPGYEFDIWYGLIGPAKLPRPLVDALAAQVARILEIAEVRERFFAQGAQARAMKPQEFDRFIALEVARLGKTVKASGAKPE